MVENASTNLSPAEVVRRELRHYLGPFTAKNAVDLGAKQSLHVDADHLTRADVPKLLDALGPTVRTLLGKNTAEKVFEQIRKELAL